MSRSRARRRIRPTAPPGATRAQARARRSERQLDELLWQVSAEPDLPVDPALPAELGAERIARDVERWRRTLVSAPTTGLRTHRAGLRAAVAALVLCATGAGGYWQGSDTALRPALTAATGLATELGSEKSWYVQVARAPSDRPALGWQRGARACSNESWYCVQVADSRRREL
jgi:hypothetical protein